MAGRDDAPRVHVESVEEWRDWLLAHHATEPGAWLVSWKASTGRPCVQYERAVEEALCVGWIDSAGRTLDDERRMLWFTRRKPGSGWARTNKERIVRLEAEGRMTPAGRAVIDAAKADGSWTLLDDVENLVVPDDLAAAFDRHPGSRQNFDAFPPSARRAILEWIVHAKREATRAARLQETARLAAQNLRANQWKPKE
ncbi:YdeI/OmpD-associated family protein [Cellulomonas fengjieae]|uniref:YdeI/OmpD-associated family protein n=1 Tax=Cellulomonas fengjieae TaxID=2819978 RepID=UPI001AAEB7B5|nr:YdeI/OmpD-associated family protein [Cellulomonas fengjieae]MBO3100904.1 YdeI/OmpD-associated family protein [Cellulomonas fengjieae]